MPTSLLSAQYRGQKKKWDNELLSMFVVSRKGQEQQSSEKQNRKIVQQRKQEYRKKEAEACGLLVNKPGAFIGLTCRGVTVSHKGKVLSQHHPRQPLTNCGDLYVRAWQALLAAGLNPFEGLIHTCAEGKPALVYDFVELFRSQVVDRTVISLIQKGHELEVRNGLLTDNTRQTLVKAIMEPRYEKYQGEEMKMETIIQRQAKMLAKCFAGEVDFKAYVAKW